MIYSHFAVHHRHYVWTPFLICLVSPTVFLLFTCLSFLLNSPPALNSSISPLLLPQPLLYCINETRHFLLLSLILSDPCRRHVCLLIAVTAPRPPHIHPLLIGTTHSVAERWRNHMRVRYIGGFQPCELTSLSLSGCGRVMVGSRPPGGL